MFSFALGFFILAIIFAVFAFTGIGGALEKIFFVVYTVLFLVCFVAGFVGQRR